MFSNKTKAPKIDTLIGPNTRLEGDVEFDSGFHVDGKVAGNIYGIGAEATLTVSEQGRIEGDVRVPFVVLNGTVIGDVYASERIELAPHARISGNVYYNVIEMASGAEVNGNMVHQVVEAGARTSSASKTSAKETDVMGDEMLGSASKS